MVQYSWDPNSHFHDRLTEKQIILRGSVHVQHFGAAYPKLNVFCNEVLRVHSHSGTPVSLEQLVLIIKVTSYVTPLDDSLVPAIPHKGNVGLGDVDEDLLPANQTF